MTEPQLDLYLKEIQRSNNTRFVEMANAARLAQAPQNDFQRIIGNALYEVEE